MPCYLEAYNSGLLKDRANELKNSLRDCNLCPRDCRADRLCGELGTCSTGEYAKVSSYMPHFGEESPISGHNGSGTIFFTQCNLLCNFCQNFDISHEGRGESVSHRQLADMMLTLQSMKCHNINFVSPSHVVPQILQALLIAVGEGLNLPLVYNSGGYDSLETLMALDGIIDIYMPDFKFWDPIISEETCNASDYPVVAKRALKEMNRQVGDLSINANGIAEKGLLVRHLVMPEDKAGTSEVMKFLHDGISKDTYVNVMPQYRPCGRSWEKSYLGRPITQLEFRDALDSTIRAGISRIDQG